MGKDDNAYLLNRDNLGGIAAPIAEAQVADSCNYLRGSGRPTGLTKARMLLFAPAPTHSDFPHYCNQSTYHRHSNGV